MPSSDIKAIFVDMDGTLLTPLHRVSDFTREVLAKLKEQNKVKFVLCTGRPYPDVFATIRKCGLQPDYIITSNGARIHDGNFQLLRSHDMEPRIVEELVHIWHTPGPDGEIITSAEKVKMGAKGQRKAFIASFYQHADWVTDEVIPKVREAFDAALVCKDLGDSFHSLSAADLTGVHHFWFQVTRDGTPADLATITNFMKNRYDGSKTITLTSSAAIVLEVLPYGVTKGVAVKEVCERIGVSPDDVACFGDAWNDVAMLEIAGKAFVMANASSAIHEALPGAELIGSNADDGVAKKLRELFLS